MRGSCTSRGSANRTGSPSGDHGVSSATVSILSDPAVVVVTRSTAAEVYERRRNIAVSRAVIVSWRGTIRSIRGDPYSPVCYHRRASQICILRGSLLGDRRVLLANLRRSPSYRFRCPHPKRWLSPGRPYATLRHPGTSPRPLPTSPPLRNARMASELNISCREGRVDDALSLLDRIGPVADETLNVLEAQSDPQSTGVANSAVNQ